MPVIAEEEVVLLYALHACGGSPSKSRATEFIVTNHFMKERVGDYDTVSTDESRVENRIAWTRQNLKSKGQLAMPERGTWQITPAGFERLKNVAMRSLKWTTMTCSILVFRGNAFLLSFSPAFKNSGGSCRISKTTRRPSCRLRCLNRPFEF